MAANLDLLDDSIRDAAKELVRQCGSAGLMPRVTSTLRSHSEQKRLYSRFLANSSGYPVAPPGTSAHEYGLAFDLVVSPMDALRDVADVWIDWGGGWNAADAIHFELAGASEFAKQLFKQSVENQEPWAIGALDFLTSFVGPWWTGLIPAKYAGAHPSQQAASGAVGALLKELGLLK